ncbi:hypothetical protein Q3G72_021307 [Acer saccharum]|nr:hypothetical protein Q3G72_021307 [Acer saccharum]
MVVGQGAELWEEWVSDYFPRNLVRMLKRLQEAIRKFMERDLQKVVIRKMEAKRDVNPYLSQLNEVEGERGYVVRVVVEKGKKILQKKFRVRPPAPRIYNTNLNLEKPRVFVSSEEDDSSSSFNFADRIRCPFGECSKMAQVDNGLRNGRVAEGPIMECGSSDEGSEPSFNGSRVPETDLEPYTHGPSKQVPLMLVPFIASPDRPVNNKERNVVGDGSESEEGQCQASPSNKNDAIHLEVDFGVLLGRAVKENVVAEVSNTVETSNSLKSKKRRGSRKVGSVRTHAMKTRNKIADGEGS